MNKQEKIESLRGACKKKIDATIEEYKQLIASVEDEPDSRELECFGDYSIRIRRYKYLDDILNEQIQFLSASNIEMARIVHHNIYRKEQNLTQQINYQKIINRMWQLAYELNPNHINQDSLCFDVFFHSTRKCWAPIEWDVPNEFPLPRFASKEIAQKAADDLNAKGYKL